MSLDTHAAAPASPAQEFAVRNLIATYAHALDDRRYDDCAACFRADAVLVFAGTTYTGRPAIREWMTTLPATDPGCHLTTNTVVWPESGGVLRSRSDFGLLKQRNGGWVVLARGRYEDEVVDDAEGIGFSRRTIDFS